MPAITPECFVREETPAKGSSEPNLALWISEAGALTQFGAFIEILQPGSHSSFKHWHSSEDELVYVLSGEITLIEGSMVSTLRAGDAATFKAGVSVGHFFENRGDAPTHCLVMGTRAAVDRITYPDHDRVCIRDRSLPDDIWTDTAGNPANSPYGQ